MICLDSSMSGISKEEIGNSFEQNGSDRRFGMKINKTKTKILCKYVSGAKIGLKLKCKSEMQIGRIRRSYGILLFWKSNNVE